MKVLEKKCIALIIFILISLNLAACQSENTMNNSENAYEEQKSVDNANEEDVTIISEENTEPKDEENDRNQPSSEQTATDIDGVQINEVDVAVSQGLGETESIEVSSEEKEDINEISDVETAENDEEISVMSEEDDYFHTQYSYSPEYDRDFFTYRDVTYSKISNGFIAEYGVNQISYVDDEMDKWAKITKVSVSEDNVYVAVEIDETDWKKVWIINLESKTSWVLEGDEQYETVKAPTWGPDHQLLVFEGEGTVNSPVIYHIEEGKIERKIKFEYSSNFIEGKWSEDGSYIDCGRIYIYSQYAIIRFSVSEGVQLSEQKISIMELREWAWPSWESNYYSAKSYDYKEDGGTFGDSDVVYSETVDGFLIQKGTQQIKIPCDEDLLEGRAELANISISENKKYVTTEIGNESIFPAVWVINLSSLDIWIIGWTEEVPMAYDPVWGPDNRLGVYVGDVMEASLAIYDFTNNEKKVLYVSEIGEFFGIYWSKDGSYIDVARMGFNSNGCYIVRYNVDRLEKINECHVSRTELDLWILSGKEIFQ